MHTTPWPNYLGMGNINASWFSLWCTKYHYHLHFIHLEKCQKQETFAMTNGHWIHLLLSQLLNIHPIAIFELIGMIIIIISFVFFGWTLELKIIQYVYTVPPGFCDFKEMNATSRKLCDIRKSLPIFKKLQKIVRRFGPRRVMWRHHDAHAAKALFNSSTSNMSTAKRFFIY